MKRVAVIGFGFMGIMHSRQLLVSEGVELVAIIEKDVASVAKKLNEQVGNFAVGEVDNTALLKVPVYSSLADCLQEQKLDAVHVCVHTELHYPLVKEALNNDLHVLVEKPFVLDVEQGEELVALAAEKKRVLMVAHVVRFMSPYQKLLGFIETKEYGDLKFLSLSRFSGVPQWGQWLEKQKNYGISGGALFDLVIHDIDFAAFAVGVPSELSNKTILPGKLSRHDYVSATWHYPDSDLVVRIEGGNVFHARFPFRAEYTAVFEQATMSYSTSDAENILVSGHTEQTTIPANDLGDGYFNEIQLFYTALQKGELTEKYSPESALETIRLCYRHAE